MLREIKAIRLMSNGWSFRTMQCKFSGFTWNTGTFAYENNSLPHVYLEYTEYTEYTEYSACGRWYHRFALILDNKWCTGGNRRNRMWMCLPPHECALCEWECFDFDWHFRSSQRHFARAWVCVCGDWWLMIGPAYKIKCRFIRFIWGIRMPFGKSVTPILMQNDCVCCAVLSVHLHLTSVAICTSPLPFASCLAFARRKI